MGFPMQQFGRLSPYGRCAENLFGPLRGQRWDLRYGPSPICVAGPHRGYSRNWIPFGMDGHQVRAKLYNFPLWGHRHRLASS